MAEIIIDDKHHSEEVISKGPVAELSALSPVATPSSSSRHALINPVVVPQTTNLMFLKSFSPFSHGYSPALAELQNPISQEDFSSFVDGINEALLATSPLQLSFITGGMLMNVPVLPVQAAGAGVQALSIAMSAGLSYFRAKKYMEAANENIFGPRNLDAKLLGTKKMMAEIGFTPTDAKGKLTLPAPLEQSDESFYTAAATVAPTSTASLSSVAEDPRMRRLRALDGFVAPFDIKIGDDIIPQQWLKKISTAPTRWLNARDIKNQTKARTKWIENRDYMVARLGEELAEINEQIANLSAREQMPWTVGREHPMDAEMAIKMAKRNALIGQILQTADKKGMKKMNKSNRREAKVANRILWIVITNKAGTTGDGELP